MNNDETKESKDNFSGVERPSSKQEEGKLDMSLNNLSLQDIEQVNKFQVDKASEPLREDQSLETPDSDLKTEKINLKDDLGDECKLECTEVLKQGTAGDVEMQM